MHESKAGFRGGAQYECDFFFTILYRGLRIQRTYQQYQIFHFGEISYCTSSLFRYSPIITVDLCVISWKMTFKKILVITSLRYMWAGLSLGCRSLAG